MPKRAIGVIVLLAGLLGLTSAVAAGPVSTQAGRPRAVSTPRIGGLAIIGQTLTAYRGAWAGRPTRYRYVWQRCSKAGHSCHKVGRPGKRYRISGRDVGRRLRLVVTASNRAGSRSARSPATPAVTKSGGPPTKSPPPVGGYFGLQPVGAWSRLPSGAACARLVHRSTWEPRRD